MAAEAISSRCNSAEESRFPSLKQNTMLHVLRRHYPQLGRALEGVTNAFAPWKTLTGPPDPRNL